MNLPNCLLLGAILFCIGIYGALVRRNAIGVLMAFELILNAVNINLVAFARFLDPVGIAGQMFTIFVITLAAAETAVGLALIINIYRQTGTIDVDEIDILKW